MPHAVKEVVARKYSWYSMYNCFLKEVIRTVYGTIIDTYATNVIE